jgi:competence protein CoiA
VKFANVDRQRLEAQRGLSGECPRCGHSMVAKCGEVRIWHWAHSKSRNCDPWWENETGWHRAWKGHFPESWQEIVHIAEDGAKHVADVKTARGWAIEFQHSHITPEERRSRDSFYGKLVWVVDGTRLKRAKTQFIEAWDCGKPLGSGEGVRIVFVNECSLLREWASSQAPIFFDFGEEVLWWLIAGSTEGRVWIGKYPRAEFIEVLRGGTDEKPLDLAELITWAKGQLAAYESAQRALDSQRARLQNHAFYRLLDVGRRRGRF